MFQDELQNRAHNGDQAAFRDIYSRYSRDVYAVSHTALGNADSARAVVKQVFLHLYRELMRSETDLDLAARLSALTNEEIRITRIAAGELDPESLLVQYTVASAPAVDTAHTMDRIRAHMQQNAAPAEESATDEPVTEAPAAEALVTEAPAAEASAEETLEKTAEEAPAETFEHTFTEPTIAAEEETFFTEPTAEEAPIEESIPAEEPKAEPLPKAPQAEDTPAKKKSRSGGFIAGLVLFVLLLVFAWLIVGILMDLSILPFYDLGYSLFNEYVFDFFRLP